MEENAIHAKYFELVKTLRHLDSQLFRWHNLSLQNSSVRNEIMPKRSRNSPRIRMQVRQGHSQPYASLSFLLAKSQLTKANQGKAKIEGLARELQKVRMTCFCFVLLLIIRSSQENKRLRVRMKTEWKSRRLHRIGGQQRIEARDHRPAD